MMIKLTFLVVMAIAHSCSFVSAVANPRTPTYSFDAPFTGWREAEGSGTTLKQVQFLHRHGDRTPTRFPIGDPLKENPFWALFGGGQLTNMGKARIYLLGKMIRKRYNRFMDYSVDKSKVLSRSSGQWRCIESAQLFLASFMSPSSEQSADGDQFTWSSDKLASLWQPVSIQSVPSHMDGLLAADAHCVNEQLDDQTQDTHENVRRLIGNNFDYEIKVIKKRLGHDMVNFSDWWMINSLIEIELAYMRDEPSFHHELEAIWPKVHQAGHIAMGVYSNTHTSKRLRCGLLIRDIVRNMETFRSPGNKKDVVSTERRFVHYSAHDITVAVLLSMLGSWDRFTEPPNFGANLMFELHHDHSENNDEWFVRVFYMQRVPTIPVELRMEACEHGNARGRCTLDRFSQLLQSYFLETWHDWMQACGNTMDQVNPYRIST